MSAHPFRIVISGQTSQDRCQAGLDARDKDTVRSDVTSGPVIVSIIPGAKIIVQIYELKRPGTSGKYNGQSQMMGMPIGYLTDTAILPWYNNTLDDLDATLIFGVS